MSVITEPTSDYQIFIADVVVSSLGSGRGARRSQLRYKFIKCSILQASVPAPGDTIDPLDDEGVPVVFLFRLGLVQAYHFGQELLINGYEFEPLPDYITAFRKE